MTSRPPITTIGLDGDDTLWHSETHFADAQVIFAEVVAPYVDPGLDLESTQYATERRNLELFGYGAKGFTLSMIESAIEVTGGRITTAGITRLLELGKGLLRHPVELLDGVAETVDALARGPYRLVLVTKGDLFHQEQKVAMSGLAERFEQVAIVSEKDEVTYRRVIADAGATPEEFLMVGNSVRSDVLPVLALGGQAVHIPYSVTWDHEVVDHDGGFPVLERLADLPAWLADRT